MLRRLSCLAVLSGCWLSHDVPRRDDAGGRDAGMTRRDAARPDATVARDAGADAWLESGEREAIVEIQPMAMNAFFYERDAPPSCARRTDGPCNVETCERLSDIGPLGVSAGEITIRGADTTYVMPYRSSYVPIFLDEPAWSLDVATDWAISAPGDIAGAFDGVVTSPASTTITSPDLDTLTTLDVDADFEVRWRPAPSGELHVTLRGRSSERPPNQAVADCHFPAGDGRGVVPSSALSDLTRYTTAGRITVSVDIVGRSVAFSRTHRVELSSRILLGDARPRIE